MLDNFQGVVPANEYQGLASQKINQGPDGLLSRPMPPMLGDITGILPHRGDGGIAEARICRLNHVVDRG